MASAIREARMARGWSQDRLVRGLLDEAGRRGVPVAQPASLKIMVSRWENGHALPGAVYRDLLIAVFGLSAEALRFAAIDRSGAVQTIGLPKSDSTTRDLRIDPALADSYMSLLGEYVRLDALVGPQMVVVAIRGELLILEELCRATRGSVRDRLVEVAARLNEFAGWLYQDAGNSERALELTSRAMVYAAELDDPRLKSYLLMRRSNIATDLGHGADGEGLANAALRSSPELTPCLRAVALRQKAFAHALVGDRAECTRAIDQARVEVDRAGSHIEDNDLAEYCTPSYIEMEAAVSWVQLGDPRRALEIYDDALVSWPDGQLRDRGLCLSRMAVAYAEAGEIEQACETGRRASSAVRDAPSARAVTTLRSLACKTATSRIAAVHDLRSALAGIV